MQHIGRHLLFRNVHNKKGYSYANVLARFSVTSWTATVKNNVYLLLTDTTRTHGSFGYKWLVLPSTI